MEFQVIFTLFFVFVDFIFLKINVPIKFLLNL